MRFVIVTGMSGAGKSTAMKMMEDMGFFCIDNLPIPLLDKLVDFATNFDTQMKNVAIGIDARSGENLDKVQDMLEILKSKDVQYEVLFLDAEDAVLVKRYKETRRSHPLAQGERVDKGIMRERQKMEFLKKEADYIIDTSRLLTRELKTELEKIFVQDEEFNSMYVTILSFGFKYGIPADSDIVMDVRFLPNPYYVEELRPKTGNDVEIQQYVMKYDEAKIFLNKLEDMVTFLIPHYISEGKNRLIEDTKAKMSLDDLFSQIQSGNVKELDIIVKADVQGSVEAVKQSLVKLSNEEVVVKVIHGGVGAINESDVSLASASNAIIIGFNVRPDPTAKLTADKENVDIRLYKVIYNAIEDVEAAMKGMLDPVYEEKVLGHAEIRQIFKASGVGNIAGSYVLDGMFQRGCKVRISREGEQIFEGDLASLKRFKDDVKEVKAGFECGLVFEGFGDFQELDIVEAYTMVEVPR